ncbi:hypothetical protein TWF970_006494 [Orbilia oligospora]|uniref:Uncharacterized protein n=1 Tax=Orbilia oligospora TaxID=2813651 RepID=A0A7C8VLD9_ORBOL|nr:hypothetical protein TWF970_006494 [Orbilia oligospora]
MATATEPFISIFDSDLEWSLPPSVMIEEALQNNLFMAAAAGKTFTEELPSTWKRIPRIATTAFTVPISPVTTHTFNGSSEFGYDGLGTSCVDPVSSATSLDIHGPGIPPAPSFHLKAQSEHPPHINSNGVMKPFYDAQKQSYFNSQHPFPPDTIYYDPTNGRPVHVVSCSQPDPKQTLPPFNPVEGISGRMPVFKDEIIPTFNMGYYPDLLHLPSRPSDVLVYFNSICAAAALSPHRKAWMDDNLQETEIRFCGLDDAVFQMCEAYSGKPLRGPNNELERGLETKDFKAVPDNSLFFDWALELQECRLHLERLNKLAYTPVMNKCKVEVVWKALVYFRDNWANNIFSQCDNEFWEASEEEMEWMKEYHAFNREMQRLMKTVEDDLVEVGRLENMVTAFRGAVWKAETKFKKLKDTFRSSMSVVD